MLVWEKAPERGESHTDSWQGAFGHVPLPEVGILSMHSLPGRGNPKLKILFHAVLMTLWGQRCAQMQQSWTPT